MILLDTSGLLSAIDASQRYHAECAAAGSSAAPFRAEEIEVAAVLGLEHAVRV